MPRVNPVDKDQMAEASPASKLVVLGEFSGECADANVTNENGLDILPEVWETVFASDIYKTAIEHGWYIGFLGHPEDPNCMDFEHACIVMTECHIEDNGKVYGKFNLIDTPVGRIVKSFIDAGVVFGISVRGAGDIIDNSVDPETFVFRGFDLVTFPAYKEAIPTFTEIAASTDLNKQRKYKAVCAAVSKNIEGLNTKESVEIVQACFAKQSPEYQMLEDRKNEIEGCVPDEEVLLSEDIDDINNQRLDSVMALYLDEQALTASLRAENEALRKQISVQAATTQRRIKSIERISKAQITDLQDAVHDITASYHVVKAASDRLKSENAVLAKNNLKYKQKVEAATALAQKKDSTISKLRSELDETVREKSAIEARTSNRDAKIERLEKRVEAATAMVAQYQKAYIGLYANALGVDPEAVQASTSTSVKELQSIIASTQAGGSRTVVESGSIDIVDDQYDGLVTV